MQNPDPSSQAHHRPFLEIFNYQNEEIVSNPLIWLKGRLIRGSRSETHQPKNVNFLITLTTHDADDHGRPVPYKMINDSFVLLTTLNPGRNRFQFTLLDRTLDLDSSLKSPPRKTMNFFIQYSKPLNPRRIVKGLLVVSIDEVNSELEESMVTKLTLALQLVQNFYSEKLKDAGLAGRTFSLDEAQVFRTSLNHLDLKEMRTSEVWEALAKEIRGDQRIWSSNVKYVGIFSSPWKKGGVGEVMDMRHLDGDSSSSVAMAGGGLGIIPPDFCRTWPTDSNKILETMFCSVLDPQGPEMSGTLGAMYSASMGGLAHEIGHLFDLGHTESGLMGKDYLKFSHCLAPHYFNPNIKLMIGPYVLGTGNKNLTVTFPKRSKVYTVEGDVVGDCVDLCLSSLGLLFGHRWFRTNENDKGILKAAAGSQRVEGISLVRNKISSGFGLSIIEIRETKTEKVQRSWSFPPSPKTETFTLGKRMIPIELPVVIIVAQDLTGNILKKHLERNSIPEGFTVI